MKPPNNLVVGFADDDLNQELRAFFDRKNFCYKFQNLRGKSDAEKHLKNSLPEENFDVLILTVGASGVAEAEKIIGSPTFKKLQKPTLICAKELDSEKLFKFLALGADDFVTVPFRDEDLTLRIKRLGQKNTFRDELIRKSKAKIGRRKIIGDNPAFIAEIDKLPVIARCDVCVLITGETGTGKEIIARSIHYLSPRADKPFVPVNCGAIPNDLIENELFGHERGAFTGASHSHRGLIREATGGTLFLDEIDSLPLISQVKLLRFLQDKEYRLLGSAKTLKADVRIVAASNHNLEELVQNGNFRSDLYYRLNVMQIVLPSLRERLEDIPLLARHFLEKYAVEFNKQIGLIKPEALLALQSGDWLGNVRELENVIERAVLFCESDAITISDLRLVGSKKQNLEESFRLAKAKVVAAFEKSYLQEIMQTHQGNITRAAKAAGKNRRAFFELLRKHHINVNNFKS